MLTEFFECIESWGWYVVGSIQIAGVLFFTFPLTMIMVYLAGFLTRDAWERLKNK